MGLIADINVARALDFDSTSMDPLYLQSVARAKELVRALEATVQAAYEDGAVLLNVIQSVSAAGHVAQTGIPPWELLVTVMPALRSNIANVYDNVTALVEIAQSQADACVRAGLAGSIGLRDAALYNDGRVYPSRVRNGSEAPPFNVTGYDVGHSRDGSDEDMVDLGDVLGARPAKGDARDMDQNMYAAVGRGRSDTSVNSSYDNASGPRGHGDVSGGRDSPAALGSTGPPAANNLPPAGVKIPPPEDEEFIDEYGACN